MANGPVPTNLRVLSQLLGFSGGKKVYGAACQTNDGVTRGFHAALNGTRHLGMLLGFHSDGKKVYGNAECCSVPRFPSSSSRSSSSSGSSGSSGSPSGVVSGVGRILSLLLGFHSDGRKVYGRDCGCCAVAGGSSSSSGSPASSSARPSSSSSRPPSSASPSASSSSSPSRSSSASPSASSSRSPSTSPSGSPSQSSSRSGSSSSSGSPSASSSRSGSSSPGASSSSPQGSSSPGAPSSPGGSSSPAGSSSPGAGSSSSGGIGCCTNTTYPSVLHGKLTGCDCINGMVITMNKNQPPAVTGGWGGFATIGSTGCPSCLAGLCGNIGIGLDCILGVWTVSVCCLAGQPCSNRLAIAPGSVCNPLDVFAGPFSLGGCNFTCTNGQTCNVEITL